MGILSADEHARLQFAFESMKSVITTLTEEKLDLEEKNQKLKQDLEKSEVKVENLQSELQENESPRQTNNENAIDLMTKKLEEVKIIKKCYLR
eukprot:UN24439